MSKIRNDIILILSLLVVSVIILVCINLFSQKDDLYAVVYHDNDVILTIDFELLSKEKEYVVEGEIGQIIICADKDGVWIKEATCSDLVCIDQGKITNSSQTITCLPNKIVIKLVGKGVDVIV